MKDYQRTRGNKYILPTAVYHQTIWIIRDYYRMQEELDDILLESPAPPDGMPSGGVKISDAVVKAERREYMLKKVSAIETALKHIPKEYRTGVWENIYKRRAFPNDAARATYARWKSLMIYEVATSLKLINPK